ncbi:hypothetical protein D3C80_2134390 [compost metagenome]
MLAQPEQHVRRAGDQNHLFIADAVKGRHIFVLGIKRDLAAQLRLYRRQRDFRRKDF